MNTQSKTLIAYTDYKSPYAYLAKDPTLELAARTGVEIEWRPYTLDIPSFLGSAEVDGRGQILQADRNDHQWRRVKYSYMDCRRLAARRGLTIRAPRRIHDSSLVHIGMLYARQQGVFAAYHDAVFERFWKREFVLESLDAIAALLSEVGGDGASFAAFADGDGRAEHDRIIAEAHELGVFGVPSFVVDGQLFWGQENLALVEETLTGQAA